MVKKALVIDNDFFFVEFLTELLEKRGYEILKAYDGKEGIEKLKQGTIDLLFVDLVMPKIDGRELIRFSRSQFPDAQFPIVAVSGTLVEQLDELDTFGADYYIAKGPMETMAGHVGNFMDKLESQGLPFPGKSNITEPEKLFPRQETRELIDALGFHRAIIDSLGVGIIVAEKDARIVKINSEALEILNKPYEDVLNCLVTDLFSAREVKYHMVNALKNVVRNRKISKINFQSVIGGRETHVVVSLLNMEGKILGWIIVLEDMSQWVEQV